VSAANPEVTKMKTIINAIRPFFIFPSPLCLWFNSNIAGHDRKTGESSK
jgi:hypothetical protein